MYFGIFSMPLGNFALMYLKVEKLKNNLAIWSH